MSRLTPFIRVAAAVAAFACSVALTGCVTEVIKTDSDNATLFVTRAADTATLSWISKPNLVYTIVYTTDMRGGRPWQPVQGGSHIQGNGDQITFVEKIPDDEPRYYRLQVDKAK